ncbi:unnamed protein product [Parascedosporium putredinis]|uniref:Protein kinase domain-containing protein n=1 Tax=Parascedosporium putredinis TaxID=1442378 RepID=A0A9P1GZ51_9PEZI|nr:unnamed protein product [Parascedosporium putredinis]CAI7991308.1 unnamed protein product [Parascedosporium putredinis]
MVFPSSESGEVDPHDEGSISVRRPFQVPSRDLVQENNRTSGFCMLPDGGTRAVVFEWVPALVDNFHLTLTRIKEELPNTSNEGQVQPYTPKTLNILGYVEETDQRIALVDLVHQVRLLRTEFHMSHAALRMGSFVFIPRDTPIVEFPIGVTAPYILDWGGYARPSIYQHPGFDGSKQAWYYDAWSVVVIISEVLKWELVQLPKSRNLNAFAALKNKIKTNLQKPNECIHAALFRYAFAFLDQRHDTLARMTVPEIETFYDTICRLI